MNFSADWAQICCCNNNSNNKSNIKDNCIAGSEPRSTGR